MRETADFYFFWKHQFGQWTQRAMVDPSGQRFNCCEQYMMVKKAELFGDAEIAAKIMNTDEPSVQQQLGREVSGYDAQRWDANKFGIVWYGNYLKFTQHQDLADRLIATGDKILAEASPYDLVWGVGYAAADDDILNADNWRGENLLGEVLMSVRAALLISGQAQK